MPEPSHLNYRKSSYSTAKGEDCVEVADLPSGGAAVRDSQHPRLGHLEMPAREWAALLGALRVDNL